MKSALWVLMVAVLGAACTTSPLNDGQCQPFGQFGSFGCTIVEGRVMDADRGPAAGAYVTVIAPGVQGDVVRTDDAGGYQVWAARVFRPPGDTSQTSAVWVRASISPPDDASPVRDRADSVAVTVRWAPNGSRPDTLAVPDIVIPPRS